MVRGGSKVSRPPRKDPEGSLKISGCEWERLSPVRTEQGGLTECIIKDFGEIKHGSSNRQEPKVLRDFSNNSDHLPKGVSALGRDPVADWEQS